MSLPLADPSVSGSTALSTDGKTIAATNLFDGIDWYSAEENVQQSRFRRTSMHTMAANVNVVLPIIFIHEAEEVLSGGSIGGARITSVTTGQTVQLLDHGGAFSSRISSLSARKLMRILGNGSELVQAVVGEGFRLTSSKLMSMIVFVGLPSLQGCSSHCYSECRAWNSHHDQALGPPTVNICLRIRGKTFAMVAIKGKIVGSFCEILMTKVAS